MSSSISFSVTESDIEKIEKCPVCNGIDFTVISQLFCNEIVFLETWFCNECGLVFRGVRPNIDWFIRSWSCRDSFQVRNGGYKPNIDIEQNRYQRYDILASFLEKITSGRKILDIGTGTGGGLLLSKNVCGM